MLFPVKIKLATFEAEELRRYMQRMLEISMDKNARNEVIALAEYYPRVETAVRSKMFQGPKVSTYTLPLSVSRILWYRWQQENNGEVITMILGKIDYQLNAINRLPTFPKTIL